jgi:hypothetical protein
MIKIINLFGFMINTILTLPFFNTFLVFIICKSNLSIHLNNDCYSGIYFVHLSFSILNLIYFFMFCIIFLLLYIDLNPSS